MKLLVVDDHVLIREALRAVLKDLETDLEILEAPGCIAARSILDQHSDIRLILLDLGLPDGAGLALLAELREKFPAISIVVLSGLQDRDSVIDALKLGAAGFIPKTAARGVMLGALKLVLSGGIYIPPEVLAPAGTTSVAPISNATSGAIPPNSAGSHLGLTTRQQDVIALMMRGKSNKAICRILDLAEPTVRNHVSAILKTLNAANRTEAVMIACEMGWNLAPRR